MAFVLEKIPEDKKKKYGLELDNTWSIDHERNAVLIHSDGLPEAKFYDLHWKDRIIRIASGVNNIQLNKGGTGEKLIFDIEYNIHYIEIPDSLRNYKDIIKSMIAEALTVYGFAGISSSTRNIMLNNLDDSVIKFSEQTLSEIKFQRKQLAR